MFIEVRKQKHPLLLLLKERNIKRFLQITIVYYYASLTILLSNVVAMTYTEEHAILEIHFFEGFLIFRNKCSEFEEFVNE